MMIESAERLREAAVKFRAMSTDELRTLVAQAHKTIDPALRTGELPEGATLEGFFTESALLQVAESILDERDEA